MIKILVEHKHDLKNCQPVLMLSQRMWAWQPHSQGSLMGRECMSEYTTQGPFGNNELCCIDIGPWVREPKSQSLSTQSEQVTHLNIETHHKTLWVSAGKKMEKKEKWYKKKKEGKSKLALCACPSARMVW